jgi:ferredoxin
MSCLNACPKDCILEHRPASGTSDLPNQLYIDPDDCIDCGACAPECPWEAIFADVEVPDPLAPDVALNALVRERRAEFRLPAVEQRALPSPAAIETNKERWGLGTRR